MERERKTQWPHSNKVSVLLKKAAQDSDRVSIFGALPAHGPGRPELAVVVIKGEAEIELFKQWAERSGILTPCKGI